MRTTTRSNEDARPGEIGVAMIAPGEVFGGAERQLLYLMSYLQRQRFRCLLICFHENEFSKRARELGVPVYVLPARPIIKWRNARKIAELLRAEDIRVIHVNGYKATAHALLARLFTDFRVVKTEHGKLEISSHLTIADLKPRLFRFVENVAARMLAARIVYVTEDLRVSCAKEHAGLAGVVILNGIDFAAPMPQHAPEEFDSSAWNAVVVGRLEPVKGIEFAIRAMADLKAPPHARLWIVGEGPLKQSLQELVASLRLNERVKFTGFRRDAVAFLTHADAMVMPSLHEGLPYTLLEAVAARTAVIASDVGGLSEVLADGQTALLAPPGDVNALAQAIARMALDPTLTQRLADAAYTALSARHSVERMGQGYALLYTTLSRSVTRGLAASE